MLDASDDGFAQQRFARMMREPEEEPMKMMPVECMWCGFVYKQVEAPPASPDLPDSDHPSSGFCLDCCGLCGKKKPVDVVLCAACAAIYGQVKRTSEDIAEKTPGGNRHG